MTSVNRGNKFFRGRFLNLGHKNPGPNEAEKKLLGQIPQSWELRSGESKKDYRKKLQSRWECSGKRNRRKHKKVKTNESREFWKILGCLFGLGKQKLKTKKGTGLPFNSTASPGKGDWGICRGKECH